MKRKPKKLKIKRPPGRPRKEAIAPYIRARIRPETLQAIRMLAAILDVDWQDILDETIQIGTGYVYQRNRMNKAIPIKEIPEIWEKLPETTKMKSLVGTEMPTM